MGKQKYNTETFIDASKKKYGNDLFDYSKLIYVKYSAKIILICKNGHEFSVSPDVHLRKKSNGGCRKCADVLNGQRVSQTQTDFITKAIQKHGQLYDYSEVVYKKSNEFVTIVCKTHGPFHQIPASHLMGYGCIDCGIEKSRNAKFLNNEDKKQYIDICLEKHNHRYEYIEIFRNGDKLCIKYICDKHGEQIQRLDHHKIGHGCPFCVVNWSKSQYEWLTFLEVLYGEIKHSNNSGEYRIKTTQYLADGYHKETNTIFEFHGDYWHGNPNRFKPDEINKRLKTTFGKLYEKTLTKHETILKLGYNLVYVWENDWKRGKYAVKFIQKLWRSKHSV